MSRIWFALIGLALAAAVVFVMRGLGKISGEEAKQRVAAGARLVDVRTPSEFSSGHIDGAINIPVDELGGRLDELGDRSDPIVVYCRSGMRSGRAKAMLSEAGFADVADLGAMSRWP